MPPADGTDSPVNILLVDDVRANLQALEATLEPLHQRLVSVASGEEALRAILQQDFACILLDVQMPGLDGFATARLIQARDRSRSLPILFVTAMAREQEDMVRGYAEGAVDYIVKPYSPELVRSRVGVFVDLYRRRQEMERREAEQRRNDDRLQLALRATALGTWDFDPRSGVLSWDHRCKELFGLRPDAAVDYPVFLAGLHHDDRERVDAVVQEALDPRGSGSYDTEYRTFGRDGTIRWCRANGRAFFEHGQAVRFIGTIQDITEQKRSQRALQESETRFRDMADHAPVMLWVTDANGACTYLSQGWYDFTGQTPAEGLGFGWLSVVHPDDSERAGALFASANASHQPFHADYRLRRSDGVYRWAIDSARPRFSATGEYLGYIGTVIDITERKEAEQTLRKALETRDAFLSVASHELKTPLTPLSLRLDNLERIAARQSPGEPFAESVRQNVSAARRQLQKLDELVSDLLDVARIGAGRFPIELVTTDLSALAADVAGHFASEAEAVATPLKLELEPGISGLWDPRRLEQVITHLLSNALKYGTRKPVTLTLSRTEQGPVLAVQDHGIGIAPEAQERIFRKFERAVSERHYGGLGLGLYVTRHIVDSLGGRITVESAPGEGARFVVQLPWASPPQSGEGPGAV